MNKKKKKKEYEGLNTKFNNRKCIIKDLLIIDTVANCFDRITRFNDVKE